MCQATNALIMASKGEAEKILSEEEKLNDE